MSLDPDTLRRLGERQEDLAKVFLDESDPARWPSLETKEGRGDAVWMKKNAASTLALVCRIQTLFQAQLGRPLTQDPEEHTPGDEEFDVERAEREAMKEAEAILASTEPREAKALIAKVQRSTKKK